MEEQHAVIKSYLSFLTRSIWYAGTLEMLALWGAWFSSLRRARLLAFFIVNIYSGTSHPDSRSTWAMLERTKFTILYTIQNIYYLQANLQNSNKNYSVVCLDYNQRPLTTHEYICGSTENGLHEMWKGQNHNEGMKHKSYMNLSIALFREVMWCGFWT